MRGVPRLLGESEAAVGQVGDLSMLHGGVYLHEFVLLDFSLFLFDVAKVRSHPFEHLVALVKASQAAADQNDHEECLRSLEHMFEFVVDVLAADEVDQPEKDHVH